MLDTASVGSSIKSYNSATDKDLQVPDFDADDKTIWNLLNKLLSSTVACWSYIMDYAEGCDGRGHGRPSSRTMRGSPQ